MKNTFKNKSMETAHYVSYYTKDFGPVSDRCASLERAEQRKAWVERNERVPAVIEKKTFERN